jgi:hypothetical protein
MSEFAETDSADAELAHIGMRPTADFASVVFAGRKLLSFLLL